jgi:hypothetical protein
MNKQQARELIRQTFENSFDKARFTVFIKNLLNQLEEAPLTYQGQYVPDAYKPYISVMERLGKFQDSDQELDVLIVRLKKETSLERARTRQRNFVAWYLNGSRGGKLKDAALVAFVSPSEADWRFSLVRMDYKFEQAGSGRTKVKEEFTPARRWSFLVGVNENSHTAQSRLVNILVNDETKPTMAELEEAFDIETVTREFFLKYRDLFIRSKEALDKTVKSSDRIRADLSSKDVNTVDFAKKLLGQIVFLYFLQKKGWFGAGRDAFWGDGSKQFLRELFEKRHGGYGNFFNDILEPLFYEALRIDRSHDDDYYSRFNCKIPFLNGGLFDPIGNYDWVHTDITLPDTLFSNAHKTPEGDVGDGILDVFDRYNFTVREDEPLEKEVAIDPELLGKTYEKFNAIRPDNFEEYKRALKSGKKGDETKFNKQFGVYYTPREIVHYMCQQSLINYLYNELNQGTAGYQKMGDPELELFGNEAKKGQLDLVIENRPPTELSKEDIEILIHHGDKVDENEALVQKRGRETAAYPYRLPESVRKSADKIDQKLADVAICDPAVGSGAFPVGMMNEIIKARNALSAFLPPAYDRSSYEFKRRCIEHSLYGVDIDPGAVEIAKLRLWLSLVVDEEDIKTIKPLPNLDYKIVCGNSLLGVEKSLLNEFLYKDLERIKPLYFNETVPAKKLEYKRQIDDLINQITNGRKEFDFEIYFSEVFHDKNGFDVVIGNPPYVSHDRITIKKSILQVHYSSYEPFADLYCYFIEKGIKLQNKSGLIAFITSNSYLRSDYGLNLRKLLKKENELLGIVNLDDAQIFEDAIVNVAILFATNKIFRRQCYIFNQSFTDTLDNFQKFIDANLYYYEQRLFSDKSWNLAEPDKLIIQQKIEKSGKTLEQLGVKIRLGLATGDNNAFIIDEVKRKELIKINRKNSEIIKPILRGRDIFRYAYKSPNLYILLTRNGINVQKEYPDIYKYLDGFGQPFKKRGAQGQHWTNLRATAFFDDFKKQKIVWIELTDIGRFAICTEELYLLNSAYFLIPPPEFDIKYLLGLLNSKIIYFYLGLIAETSGMGVNRWINNYVKQFSIPHPTHKQQQSIVNLVDRILTEKNADFQSDTSMLEKEIDLFVYQLYGLTKDEIYLIENSK